MAVPYFRLELDEATVDRTVEVLRSRWLTTGPAVKQFEQEFAAFVGGGVEAVAVNSCTAGLHLALEAMGIGEGDEVITTDLTFTATAEVIRYLGATPVLVDCDANTLCVDFDQVEEKIMDNAKAAIIVYFAGDEGILDSVAEHLSVLHLACEKGDESANQFF
ncbi:MAG: aminotransferase class I/II-fold pyridoxal phosphate-dependent enzyme [Pseudomonadota bacterium]